MLSRPDHGPVLRNKDASFFTPDSDHREALARTTHLGIGAHQDDLEFMALHGILECLDSDTKGFGGITCTDGAGSARTGPYQNLSDREMTEVRRREQVEAARIGRYTFMAQMGYPSGHVRDPGSRTPLVEDLAQLLETSEPEIVYTHNPFDKHPTHLGVLLAVVEAIRKIPKAARPRLLLGCEGWRGLDWLPDREKVILPIADSHAQTAERLAGVFQSQIAGGKRYDLAIRGRRRANATFFDPHSVDEANETTYAVDLSAFLSDDQPDLLRYVREMHHRFGEEMAEALLLVTGG